MKNEEQMKKSQEAARYCLNGATPMSDEEITKTWSRLDILSLMLDAEVRVQHLFLEGIDTADVNAVEIWSNKYLDAGRKSIKHGGSFSIGMESIMPLLAEGLNAHAKLTALRLGEVLWKATNVQPTPEQAWFVARKILWDDTPVKDYMNTMATAYGLTVDHYPIDRVVVNELVKKTLEKVIAETNNYAQVTNIKREIYQQAGFSQALQKIEKIYPLFVDFTVKPQVDLTMAILLSMSSFGLCGEDTMPEFLSNIGQLVVASGDMTDESMADLENQTVKSGGIERHVTHNRKFPLDIGGFSMN